MFPSHLELSLCGWSSVWCMASSHLYWFPPGDIPRCTVKRGGLCGIQRWRRVVVCTCQHRHTFMVTLHCTRSYGVFTLRKTHSDKSAWGCDSSSCEDFFEDLSLSPCNRPCTTWYRWFFQLPLWSLLETLIRQGLLTWYDKSCWLIYDVDKAKLFSEKVIFDFKILIKAHLF